MTFISVPYIQNNLHKRTIVTLGGLEVTEGRNGGGGGGGGVKEEGVSAMVNYGW